MASTVSELRAPLGFTRAEDVSLDPDRPGLLRARTLPFGVDPEEAFDYRSCVLNDCASPAIPEPGLEEAGFESIDLSHHGPLQQALATVRDEDRISDATAGALRESLSDARFCLANGKSLRVQHVADEGLVQRRAGPNGLNVNPGGMEGANGHGGAPSIHADQDVFGTPLQQLMKGSAPSLFRHQTPDARNDDSSLLLLNLWIPIQQITRPLVLMDRRSLDQRSHQLRYGLPVTRFLDREDERSVNDIWTFLPDSDQRWYFRSSMGPDRGYVFDTLGEPHGSCVLPGEAAVEALYHRLGHTCEVIETDGAGALGEVATEPPPPLPEVTTEAIHNVWQAMADLLHEATTRPEETASSGDSWLSRARTAMDASIRKSVEMRLVATLVAD